MNHQGPQPEFVQDLFSSIAGTYDKANDVITFGMARNWRKTLVKLSGANLGDKVLDCATGTGDLAFDFKKSVGKKGSVIATDFCQEMLNHGPEKSNEMNLAVEFIWADTMDLKFEDNSFDVCSISYGIRNVQDPLKAIKEMARVTRPGGKVMVLETGEIKNPLLGSAMQFYCKHLVPRLGALVSGNREAYEYLNRSSSQFPSEEDFINLMNSSQSFQQARFHSLMGGASYIYEGIVK